MLVRKYKALKDLESESFKLQLYLYQLLKPMIYTAAGNTVRAIVIENDENSTVLWYKAVTWTFCLYLPDGHGIKIFTLYTRVSLEIFLHCTGSLGAKSFRNPALKNWPDHMYT